MRRIRHLVLVLVLALVVAAPGCDGMDVVLELFVPVDLSASDDAAEQAAGASASETEKLRQADRAVDEALDNKDPEKLDEAIELRPRDPRYLLYRLHVDLMLGTAGSFTAATDELEKAKSLHKSALEGATPEEQERRFHEMYLDVTSQVLRAYRDDPNATRAAHVYCDSIRSYETEYGSAPEGLLYLQFVDRDPCE